MRHTLSIGLLGLAAVGLLAGCGGSGTPAAAPAGSGTANQTTLTPTPPGTTLSGTTLSGTASLPAAPPTAKTGPAAGTSSTTVPGTSPAVPSISIPPFLCDATDIAQNTADAYMGALSAGDGKQASACVLPGTVPAAVTRGLLATEPGTAVYLPRAGVDGPTVFGYQGNHKSIDVTVTKQRDGKYWITKVTVRAA